MSSLRTHALSALLALGLFACEGEEQPEGVDEPIMLAAPAAFQKGKLAGNPGVSEGPQVSFSITGRVQQGAANLTLSGISNAATEAVGFRVAGEGSGYWLLTVGAEDLFSPGQFSWGGKLDIGFALSPGPHDFVAVGFDAHGKPGLETRQTLCVQSDLFDNGNACNPSAVPPAAVAVLRWNFDADVDLSVLSPDRERYDYTHFDRLVDGKVVAELKGDASAACVATGERSEAFVWREPPGAGTWYMYANLFDLCGQSAVAYELTVYRRRDHGDGTFSLAKDKTFSGEFVRSQIETDSSRPLYLTTVKF